MSLSQRRTVQCTLYTFPRNSVFYVNVVIHSISLRWCIERYVGKTETNAGYGGAPKFCSGTLVSGNCDGAEERNAGVDGKMPVHRNK